MSTITSYYFDREIDKMSSFDFPSYTKRIKLNIACKNLVIHLPRVANP